MVFVSCSTDTQINTHFGQKHMIPFTSWRSIDRYTLARHACKFLAAISTLAEEFLKIRQSSLSKISYQVVC